MSEKYTISETTEMDKRVRLAVEFYENIFDEDEMPYIVTDRATLYDIFAGDDDELIQAVHGYYGVMLTNNDFKIKFWKLLDYLKNNRR